MRSRASSSRSGCMRRASTRSASSRPRAPVSSSGGRRTSPTPSLRASRIRSTRTSMSFNFNYADNQGTIAYFHAGIRPLRPSRTDPRFPLIGTGGEEWQGFLPKDQMPGIVNPAQGWLTNWNNNPIRGWSSSDIRELWGTEHRVQALQDGILRELAADGKLSVDDVNLV